MSNQVRHYQKAIHKDPRDAHAWFGLGRELIARNDPQGPTVLQEAVALADDPELCTGAGKLLASAAHLHLAAEAFEKALVLGAEKSIVPELARIWITLGHVPRAVEAFRTHVPVPADPEACHLYASALIHSGKESEAIRHLERGLAVDANHVPSLRLLGQVLARSRSSQAAVACFQRILSTPSGTIEDLVALATAMSDLGEHAEAIRILSEALKRAPGSYEILANLGTAQLATGAFAEAVEVLTEAVKQRPDGAHARCMLGVALHQAGRSSEAVEQLREACRLQPGWAASHFNLGRLLHALGDIDGARASLTVAQRLAPEDADVEAELAALPRLEERGSITGDLEAFRLPDLLEFLRVQRSTGTLLLGARRGAGLIRLFEGELAAASSPSTPRLGEILLKTGSIDPTTLSALVEEQRVSERLQEEPEMLGTILIRKQLVGSDQLHAAMLEQILAALGEMMTWSSGQFAFHGRAPTSRPTLTFGIQQLMLEVTRRADEAGRT